MDRYQSTLQALEAAGNLRRIPADSVGSRVVDLSTNDYLGLAAQHSLQIEFFFKRKHLMTPMTSSASRLLAARQREHEQLEALLADLYGRPALLMNSGYHANVGLVSALAGKDTVIVADRLVHASIIDGIRLSGARFVRFRHNDYDHLQRIVDTERGRGASHIIIIAESVYSMDGDRADIGRLAAVKRSAPGALLYVDEAHAFGVEGKRGLGICRGHSDYADVDVVVGTFGKALASEGAFAVFSSPTLREYAVNTARSFIFSTALSPMSAAWTRFMIEKMIEMEPRRRHLKLLSVYLNHRLRSRLPGFDVDTPSHIVPLIVGDAARAVELSRRLAERGFKVLPIRVPTVPAGTERLRVSLHADLTLKDVGRFLDVITDLWHEV